MLSVARRSRIDMSDSNAVDGKKSQKGLQNLEKVKMTSLLSDTNAADKAASTSPKYTRRSWIVCLQEARDQKSSALASMLLH